MKNCYDLVIFDWDGTLMNSIDWIVHCFKVAAEDVGLPVPSSETTKDVIGLSIERAMAVLFPDTDEVKREQLRRFYSQEYAAKSWDSSDLFPGVREMLTEFNQAGLQLAIATGKTRAGLQKALLITETTDFFCLTRTADETASKPDPKMLHEIIIQSRVAPERAVMVGDSVHDLQMAFNAGIPAIGIACGAHSQETLQQYRPLLCLNQTAELLNVI